MPANKNADALYDFLYDWVNLIANVENKRNIKIIQSHENLPTPDNDGDDETTSEDEKTYISVGYSGIVGRIGRAFKPTETDDNGKVSIKNDFEKTVEIREVNGDGDLLELLIENIERQDILDLWHKNYVVFRRVESSQKLDRTQENEWVRESLIEIVVGFARGTIYKPGWIEDVKYTGTIPGQGRPDKELTITNKTNI
jgi:hypothetical protein